MRLLERAVEILEAAAEAGDADLAQACRSVLGSLHAQHLGDGSEACAGGATHAVRDPLGPPRVPPAPPGWASGSLPEDGGIVHETVSPIHPTIKVGGVNGWEMMPTDVSLSASDLLIDDRWIRTRPTVQVEGGSYSLDGARQLQDALHHLLGVTADEEAVTAAP